jgi:hypothetical protein
MIIPVIALMVLATLLTPVFANSIRREWKVIGRSRLAHGFWLIENYDTIHLGIEVWDMKGSSPIFPLWQTHGRSVVLLIRVWIFEPGENPVYNEYMVDLSPGEFKWDWKNGYCRVSTEVTVDEEEPTIVPIVVEWNMDPPVIPDDWDDGDYRQISMSKEEGTAYLTTIEGLFGEEVTYESTTASLWEETHLWRK